MAKPSKVFTNINTLAIITYQPINQIPMKHHPNKEISDAIAYAIAMVGISWQVVNHRTPIVDCDAILGTAHTK